MKIVLILLFPLSCFAQSEQLALNIDKVVCLPGDTVWLSGFVNGPSTNMYVRIYDSASKAVYKGRFMVYHHVTEGSFLVPRRPGSYWIQAYTKGSEAWRRSILVRDSTDSLLIINRQYAKLNDSVVHMVGDTGGLLLHVPAGSVYSVSVQHGTAAAYTPDSIDAVEPYDSTIGGVDTSYITVNCNIATRWVADNDYVHLTIENDSTVEAQKRRALDKREAWLQGKKTWKKIKERRNLVNLNDSLSNLNYILPIDSTKHIQLSNLIFFGDAFLHYNFAVQGSHAKDYTGLTVPKEPERSFFVPRFRVDTIEDNPIFDTFDHKTYLPTFVKKRRIPYQTRNAKIQAEYQSSAFEGASHYSRADFSPLKEADPADSDMRIADWLVKQSPNLFHMAGDNDLAFPGIYFMDEQWIARWQFCNLKVKEVAYVNYLEVFCVQGPCDPNWLACWTRSGIAARFLNGNVIQLKGYVKPVKWTKPDRHDLFFLPFTSDEYTKIEHLKPPYTITVVGMQKDGKLFTFQTATE